MTSKTLVIPHKGTYEISKTPEGFFHLLFVDTLRKSPEKGFIRDLGYFKTLEIAKRRARGHSSMTKNPLHIFGREISTGISKRLEVPLMEELQATLGKVPYKGKFYLHTEKDHIFINPRIHKTKTYTRRRLQSPSKFDPRSFRTISIGLKKRKMVVACPKKSYQGGKCQTGMQAQALLTPRNPGNKPGTIPLIYERVNKIFATKGAKSHYPGQKFYHPFTSGPKMHGLPAGAVLVIPKTKKAFQLGARTLLIEGKTDLWRNFAA